MPKTPAKIQSDYRARMIAKGYVWRGLWVRPSVWERVKAFVKKRNEEAEKEAK